MPFYAVAIGRIPGVYNTWDEAKAQVNGFGNGNVQKWRTRVAALEYVEINRIDQNQAEDGADAQLDILGQQFASVSLDSGDIQNLRALHGDKLVAFCAESARNGSVDPAAFAVSFPLEGEIHTTQLDGNVTNNRADLMAAEMAMVIADDLDDSRMKPLVIYTHYEILVSAMGATRWVDRWERNGWRGTKGPIVNRDLYQELFIADNNGRPKEWCFLDVLAKPVWLTRFHKRAQNEAVRAASVPVP